MHVANLRKNNALSYYGAPIFLNYEDGKILLSFSLPDNYVKYHVFFLRHFCYQKDKTMSFKRYFTAFIFLLKVK